jgi:pSer/pThr/pTyr-binding forkhead associated (FHA) protein
MWYLDISYPGGRTQQFDLSRGEIIIGRACDCGLVLDDISISRYHAKITIGKMGVIIEDMQSSNGVMVNGRTVVDRLILRSADEILLGNVKLNLQAGEDEERTVLFQPIDKESEEHPLTAKESLQEMSPPKSYKLPSEATDVTEMPKLGTRKEVSLGKGLTPATEDPTKIGTISATGDKYPRLFIFREGEPKKEYPLYEDNFSIGRADESDVVLDHGSISRFHAKLILSEGSWTLVDLDSANGTMVNGVPITKTTLNNLDEIYFGSVRAKFTGPPSPGAKLPQKQGEKFAEKQLSPRMLILVGILLLLIIVGVLLLLG